MLDDFFFRAFLAGIGVAIIAAPLGCFVIWRRLAYFGDTLAHGALLGVALGILLNINPVTTVFVGSSTIALLLLALQKRVLIASDSLLGLLSHATLALGLVVISFMTWVRIDINALLFGDILSVSRLDILLIVGAGAVILTILSYFWSPLFATTVNRELAQAEGINTRATELIFMLLLAATIAIAMEIVGILLITALLIIPAAAARRIASGPESMAFIATAIGVVSVAGGLGGSFRFDTPSGPSIVVAALLIFLITLSPLVEFFKKLTSKSIGGNEIGKQ